MLITKGTNEFSPNRPTIYYWILFIATIVYFITAYNSHGYFHADEHFQIIEFARLKMSMNTPDAMPWEFRDQVRSTIQPLICFLFFKFFYLLHITDPYTLSFFLRLLTALLALYSIHHFITCTEDRIPERKEKIVYYFLSYLIWFIPFISVRFSSETWGGLFFLNALSIQFDQRPNTRNYLLMGCLFGISFLFRFQMAFASLGFVLWLICIYKIAVTDLGKLITGALICILAGVIIDCWFYGNLVFSPWNYFHANVVNDIASAFGTSPWYTYLEEALVLPGYFLGALLLLSLLLLLIKQPKNSVIWCIIPFLIVHSIIPHKEERFMFPLIYLLPLLLISAYQKLRELVNGTLLIVLKYLCIVFFVTLNSAGLLVMANRSAAIGKMEMVRYIHEHYPDKPVNLIYCVFGDVLDKHGGIIPYKEKKLHAREIKNLCALADSLIIPGEENILVIKKEHLQMESCSSTISENHFILQKQSVPVWAQWLNDNIYNGFTPTDVYELYRHE
jgi:phosphatidylinositol glycan class B